MPDPLTPEQLEALFASGPTLRLERELSDEEVAEFRLRFHPQMDAAQQVAADITTAENLGKALLSRGIVGPPKGGAWVRVLCGDCRGETIAHVTISSGRPVLWVRQSDSGGRRSFADPPAAATPMVAWGDRATCRRGHQYDLPYAALLNVVADGGGRHAVVIMRHDGTGGVRYR
ncbi:MAG: hypothetical protein KQH57_17330 [Actinomycetales bacterium]|nr:hypothetical protein [Actinomycetales bacterium]